LTEGVAGPETVAPIPIHTQRGVAPNSDGSGARRVAQELDVRGVPAWSPDGKWIAIAALREGEPRLFKLPATGGPAVALTDRYALDPVWSPSGRFLVYTAADVGTVFEVRAVGADGAPRGRSRISR
jgi:TolB protein